MGKLLAFQLSDDMFQKLSRFCALQHITCVNVTPGDYLTPLGVLAAGQANSAQPALPVKLNDDSSILLFCDVSDEGMDNLLAGLRQNQINVAFKAVLTKTNSSWNYFQLLSELRKERASY
jgi:hypothetical protein